jgi:predicted outer membrane repeat protein
MWSFRCRCLLPALLLPLALPAAIAAPVSPRVSRLDVSALPAAASCVLRVPQDVPTLDRAIAQVGDGCVIELAAGTYAAPAGGFRVSNAGKSFTLRAASGAAVVLDGGGSHPIFVLRNSSRSRGGLVAFENLTFRHGGGGSATLSPGVTVDAGEARFVGCRFEDNAGDPGVAGGAVKVRNGSDARFLGCSFTGNSSPISGGALLIHASSVEVSGGSFVGNRVNLPGQDPSSNGGAISVVDGALQVSNALFQGNQAGWVGGAIYAIGTWTATPETPHTSVSIARSTFLANASAPQPCCPPPSDPAGGAIHVEDQATLDVQGSRFVDNQAQFGGALDSYRALIHVAGSVFQGNRGSVAGPGLAFGGAVSALSNDAADSTTAGGQNPRPAGVTVAGSLLEGRHAGDLGGAGGGAVANAGGCLAAGGDEQHLYGLGGLAPEGTLATNRASVAITGSVFHDCDVEPNASATGSSGGAINGSLVVLSLEDSLVLSSNAVGQGRGGALFLANESDARIARTTFAGNTADSSGGAIFAGASNVEIGSSRFVDNQAQLGAALYSIPLGFSRPHVGSGDASGVVSGTTFSQNGGIPLWDVDFGGASPVNTMQYNGNDFFNPTSGDRVYVNTFTDPGRGGSSVFGLNALLVSRFGGPTTVKAAVPNRALFGPPAAGTLKAIPPAGSSSSPSLPILAYAWSGGFATLNGLPLSQHEGLIEGAPPASYTLVVDGVTVDTVILQGSGCTADPTLCLANDRFQLQVSWERPTGERGAGHPVALSGDTGYFWFFDPANVELVVKVLDGRALNQRFWVFYGALSNVKYTLTVTDTVTGAVKVYVNPQNRLASLADTAAFAGTGDVPPAPPVISPPLPPAGGCAAGPAELCLGNRFRVSVAWKTSTGKGVGTARPLTGDTGTFWFFNPENVELVVKVLDGRALNNQFWAFYGALSDVEYTLTVTDTQTGRKKTYFNRQGTLASVADTSALPGP